MRECPDARKRFPTLADRVDGATEKWQNGASQQRRRRMRQLIVVVGFGLVLVGASMRTRAAAAMPEWAYAIPQPPAGGAAPAAAPPDTSVRQLPGSTLTFTRQQISDGFGPADWFPSDHPA